MVVQWCFHVFSIVSNVLYGFSMVFLWFFNGFSMVSMVFLWFSLVYNGEFMVSLWLVLGGQLNGKVMVQ